MCRVPCAVMMDCDEHSFISLPFRGSKITIFYSNIYSCFIIKYLLLFLVILFVFVSLIEWRDDDDDVARDAAAG